MSMSNDFAKLRIRYNGPIGNHRVIGLATKTKYGRHKRGDVFWVHRDDIAANEELFTVLGDGSNAARLPMTPDQVRLDDIPAPQTPKPVQPNVNPIADELQGIPTGLINDDEPVQTTEDADGTPIAALGLEGRVVSLLLGAGIETVEDLIEANNAELLGEISGIGEKTIEIINEALNEFDKPVG